LVTKRPELASRYRRGALTFSSFFAIDRPRFQGDRIWGRLADQKK
jgi:hypothetical protein